MKNYSEAERLEHVENWKKGSLSKTAYAKSAGIIPTTFYTWAQGTGAGEQAFVEVPREKVIGKAPGITIEKGSITIHVPLSTELKTLQTVFKALGNPV